MDVRSREALGFTSDYLDDDGNETLPSSIDGVPVWGTEDHIVVLDRLVRHSDDSAEYVFDRFDRTEFEKAFSEDDAVWCSDETVRNIRQAILQFGRENG